MAESPTAYALFLVGTFTIVAIAQEIVRGIGARRALAGGGRLDGARPLLTRNRRRYGGYVVHVGLVLALFGIAASSSFQTSRDLRLSPGDSAEVGEYTVTYERPTSDAPAGPSDEQKIVFGAMLSVTRDGEPVATLNPSREYNAGSPDPSAPIRSFFEGEPTSEVGRQEGLTRDLWSAMQPDLSSFDAAIERFDTRYAAFLEDVPDEALADPRVQERLAAARARRSASSPSAT